MGSQLQNHKTILIPVKLATDENLQKFHAPLLAWLKKYTGYNAERDTSNQIKLISGTKYYNYRFNVQTLYVRREFEKKIYNTDKCRTSYGKDLNPDDLWTARSDLLDFATLIQKDDHEDFLIRLAETSSITDCNCCKGVGMTTCSHCHGRRIVSCPQCHGEGTVEEEVLVTCPKCHGKGTYYNKTCPECGNNASTFIANMIDSRDGHMGNRAKGSGVVHQWQDSTCSTCNGTGRVHCRNCAATGSVTCSECKGSGHMEHVWTIHQQLAQPYEAYIEHRDTGFPVLLPSIPHHAASEIQSLFSKVSTDRAVKEKISDSALCDFSKEFDVFLEKISGSLSNSNQRIISQSAELFRAVNYVKVEYEYRGKQYVAWIDFQDPRFIYEFAGEGFCAAWKRSKSKFMEKLNFFQRIAQRKTNFLEAVPDDLSPEEKAQLNQKLTPISQKARHFKEMDKAQYPPPQVPRSPQPDIQIPSAATPAPRGEKSQNIYAVLAILLPGVHNLYAGYTIRGIIQLALSILTLGGGLALVWLWAVIEASCVKTDAKKNLFQPGFVQWIARALLALLLIALVQEIIKDVN